MTVLKGIPPETFDPPEGFVESLFSERYTAGEIVLYCEDPRVGCYPAMLGGDVEGGDLVPLCVFQPERAPRWEYARQWEVGREPPYWMPRRAEP